jgi:Ca2+-binding EF-hand superfamily protein
VERPSADATFDRLDVNHDGKLSASEAATDPKVQGAWKKVDANNKGAVSKAEFQAHTSAIKKGAAPRTCHNLRSAEDLWRPRAIGAFRFWARFSK